MLTLMTLICLQVGQVNNDAINRLSEIEHWKKPKKTEMQYIDSLITDSKSECLTIIQNNQGLFKLWYKDKAYNNWGENYGFSEVCKAMSYVGKCIALHYLLYFKLRAYQIKYLT